MLRPLNLPQKHEIIKKKNFSTTSEVHEFVIHADVWSLSLALTALYSSTDVSNLYLAKGSAKSLYDMIDPVPVSNRIPAVEPHGPRCQVSKAVKKRLH